MSEHSSAWAPAALSLERTDGLRLQRQCACAEHGTKCARCERAPTLQRKAAGGNEPPKETTSVGDVLQRGGEPMPRTVLDDMEPRFSHDFSDVRLHTDAAAARSAREMNSLAYTVGRHIVFSSGAFAPQTSAGRKLLAHELAHTVQQRGAAPPVAAKLEVGSPSDAYEREADSVASRVVGESSQVLDSRPRGDVRMLGASMSPLIQRTTDPYKNSTIQELRKRANQGDRDALTALEGRYRAMTDGELSRYTSDPLAMSIYEARHVPAKEADGHGRFTQPDIHQQLADDIAKTRTQFEKDTGVRRRAATVVDPGVEETEGGTMAAARTDIPGVDEPIIGRSPKAGGQRNPQSPFAPKTDPQKLPQTHGHAEQSIADQLHARLKTIPREQLRGRHVWILVEQDVCSACGEPGGVLEKLAAEYPELTIEVKSQHSSRIIRPRPRSSSAADTDAAPAAELRKPGDPPSKAAAQKPAKAAATEAQKHQAVPPPQNAHTQSTKSATEGGKAGAQDSAKVGAGLRDALEKSGSKGLPESLNKPPPDLTAPKGEPHAGIPDVGEALKRSKPVLPELEGGLSPRGPRSLSSGRLGRIGAAAAEGAMLEILDLVVIVTQIVIEFGIVPILEQWQQELEAGQRKRLQAEIERRFNQYEQKKIGRKLRDCYIKQLRAAEAVGKQLYAKVALRIVISDTERKGILSALQSDKFPESPFDIDIYDVEVMNVMPVDQPIQTSRTAPARCKNCSLIMGDDTDAFNNPLWETTVTFTVEAPSSSALLKEYPQQPGEDLDKQCACFIATACYGSMLAPEVQLLREFRDRRLTHSRGGRLFIRGYYAISPRIACWLERHESCRAVVRVGLVAPIVKLVARFGGCT